MEHWEKKAVGDGYGEKKEFKVRSFLLHSFAETKRERKDDIDSFRWLFFFSLFWFIPFGISQSMLLSTSAAILVSGVVVVEVSTRLCGNSMNDKPKRNQFGDCE